jgi:hypothetical protein
MRIINRFCFQMLFIIILSVMMCSFFGTFERHYKKNSILYNINNFISVYIAFNEKYPCEINTCLLRSYLIFLYVVIYRLLYRLLCYYGIAIFYHIILSIRIFIHNYSKIIYVILLLIII